MIPFSDLTSGLFHTPTTGEVVGGIFLLAITTGIFLDWTKAHDGPPPRTIQELIKKLDGEERISACAFDLDPLIASLCHGGKR